MPDEPTTADDELLAAAMRGLADAVVIADGEGTIVLWNAAATRLFGWEEAEALGQSLDLIIPDRHRERHWEGYRRVMATGHTSYGDRLLEVPSLHRDPDKRLSIAFTVTLIGPEGGAPRAIVAVVRDETQRWQERKALRAELEQLRGNTG
ncbi:MAG TPA: PAS domain-containing protein [Acidimicrobiales bacterium]|nr:PAS domain-containing protein [Acidimicrobiales bacterium]